MNTSTKLHFTKTHGAGNDIIIIDDRSATFPEHDAALIRALADRRLGIGGEGLALIRLAETFAGCAFRMVFFNPDGTRATFCGNAARCVALFAYKAGIGGRTQTIASDAGEFKAEILSVDAHCAKAQIRVEMPPPKNRAKSVMACERDCYAINTGVPHAVVFVDDAASLDIAAEGRALRLAPQFAPDGANIDFAQITGASSAKMRVYERGVEAETGACGTGACAVGAAMAEKLGAPLPIALETSSGHTLTVDGDFGADGLLEKIRLSGPAEIVFEGALTTSLQSGASA